MTHKILLVEDDESFYDAIRLTMANHPVEIVWADTGAKGIQCILDFYASINSLLRMPGIQFIYGSV